MRKWLLAPALLLAAAVPWLAMYGSTKAQIVGPIGGIQCNNLAQASPAAVGSQVLSLVGPATQPVLRGVAGQRIYVCGWHVTATATTASTFQLVAGTDSATTPGCIGTQTILTPAFTVTNTAPATDHAQFAQFSLAAGQQLCVTTTGTAIQVGVWIGQY
jgi:hypothetical protein